MQIQKHFTPFDQIFEKKYELPKTLTRKKEINIFCSMCNIMKHLDTHNNLYICVECGASSIANSDYLMPPSVKMNIRYIHVYKRSIRFCKILDDSVCIKGPLREKLLCMFNQVQPVFKKLCFGKRKNFIRYQYVIIKLLEILRKNHLTQYFNLPKSDIITAKYDGIWILICKELKWEFIPSIFISANAFIHEV